MNMPELDNLNAVKNLVRTLISISERKTDYFHTIMTLDKVIKQLEPQYTFLKNIHLSNDGNLESDELVSIMSLDTSRVESDEVGKTINALLISLRNSLGDSAGHFFFKEIKQMLSDEDVSYMKEIGVDFTLMQINDEIKHLKKSQ